MSTSFQSVVLSLKVGMTATVIVALLGTACGWLLARGRFRGRTVLDVLLTMPLVLPPTVTGYYLVVLFGRHGVLGGPLYELTGWSFMFNWWGAVLASTVVALPLMFKTARAAIESVEERYVDAARMLGYSEWQVFLRVVLPLSRGGLIAGAVLSFARAVGEFGATLMVAGNIPGNTDTVPIAIYGAAASGDWGRANTLVLLFSLMTAVILYLTIKLVGRRRWLST